MVSKLVMGFIHIEHVLGISQVPFRFSGVLCCGVTFSFYQILMSFATISVRKDCLYFIFFFCADKIQWRLSKGGVMNLVFFEPCEKTYIKHRVDPPCGWKLEPVCERSHDFRNGEWSHLSGC